MAKKSTHQRNKAHPKPTLQATGSASPEAQFPIAIDKAADPTILLQELISAISEKQRVERNLRELAARLTTVQDQERRRIARDLHDNMGQKFVVLKMNLGGLAELVKFSPEAADLLSQSEALLESMSKELRTISYLLHPPLLDEIGLVSALRGLTDGFSERSGIEASLQIDDKFGRLPNDVEISIYRIVQECLTNIHRHSGSPTAKIRVARWDGEIRIEVQDNGKGMPAEKISANAGVGLGGMRQRATQLRGTLEIKSNGKGTTVLARLPLSNES